MLHAVRMVTEGAFAPLVEAGLELEGLEMPCWQSAETGEASFECYFETADEAAGCAARLEACLTEWADGERWSVSVRELAEAEWREAWKHFFRTERISPNIVIRPPWEPAGADVRCELEINPGLSFGTGRHFTTRTCLQVLDGFAEAHPGASVVDVGCGSGILAIAAVKLGCGGVTAFDLDPQAVQAARENVEVNGVTGQVRLLEASLESFAPGRTFDLVIANLYDVLLRRHASTLAQLVAPTSGARLVLSGMLLSQAPAAREAYRACGFEPEATLADNEWTTLVLARPGASTREAQP